MELRDNQDFFDEVFIRKKEVPVPAELRQSLFQLADKELGVKSTGYSWVWATAACLLLVNIIAMQTYRIKTSGSAENTVDKAEVAAYYFQSSTISYNE
ncbi:MAG: hypothetical protein Fur0041_15940 [Bacteroidia bacterium]